jgi:hypothetical protein
VTSFILVFASKCPNIYAPAFLALQFFLLGKPGAFSAPELE